jgi:two-component system, NtrC family, C4-dicarboxylate transport response regulator DctD
LREEAASIDIVLSDLGIPHLSGRELFSALHEIKPELKIFATSGFFEPALKSQLKTVGVFDFVDKPYAPDVLLQILDRAFQS